MSDDKDNKKNGLLNAAIVGGTYQTTQKYGDAVKQHFVAYSGRDNETGINLVKGLKDIAEGKINPDYEFQNISQQSGFAAEVKEVARSNAEAIINDDSTRKIRTDDLGRINDQLYDTLTIDKNGNIIDGTGEQIKFLGSSKDDPKGLGNAKRAFDKLSSKEFKKYLDNDAKIVVPPEQYQGILQEADAEINKLSSQLDRLKNSEKTEEFTKIENRIKDLKKLKENLKKASLTTEEAREARLSPKLSTAKDVLKLSHRAGLDAAQTASLIGGSVSIVKNITAVFKNEKNTGEAVRDVALDTGRAGALGYGTGFAGSIIKGAMQNSESTYIRALSKTNIAGTTVNIAITSTRILTNYFNGKIDGVQCLEMLGQEGVGMVASAMFATIGQIAIPIPVVGGLIGGMIGYALSSASYGLLLNALKEKEMAHKERMYIESVCAEHIKMIREYRLEIEKIINQYLSNKLEVFNEAFTGIKNALEIGDIDLFIENTNRITENFGGKPAFSTIDEFDKIMLAKTTIKI
ncbi:hypothetical protein [Fusobacterium pseudoperiodonticum]|uniref:hypothetical protein n=1 Tax=Fusobacterium pseudoperiodonticum TaxID=2663009 RepID=UPI0028F093FD|nr:hypothetical protein [Fusobacterium pseudoperiodonticum]